MSGIAGIIHFDGAPVEPGQIEQMTAAMAYRGPDGINHWTKVSVALGQCMLRTTPESLEETQPLRNEDESLVLVMDGRVDNWEELRRELLGRGAVLRTRADTELVLRAYEMWGKDCLAHMDGDFALVIWDARRKQAFCARDRMGIKPFHYHWNGHTLVFASELHPILALPWVAEIPNEGMLAEYLSDEWYSRDETLWTGIMRLVASHSMEVNSHGPQPKQYWAPDLWATFPYTRDEEYIEHYRELLFDTVRRLSRSHRPVAIEVSGGLDSSAIFCVAEQLRCTSRLFAPSIDGYTLAFSDDTAADDLAYARVVGDYLGVKIQECAPTRMPLSWYENRAHRYKNFPGFPNGVMHMGITEQASLHGSRVLLDGIGGDEWLGGSRVYYAEEFAHRRWRELYDCLKNDLSVFGAPKAAYWLIGHSIFSLLPVTYQHSVRQLLNQVRKTEIKKLDWLSSTMRENILQRREKFTPSQLQQVRSAGHKRLLGHLSNAFSSLALERTNNMSSGLGIESRSPLHTPAIAQFAFSTPERLRLRGGSNKYLHRSALRGIMPPAILKRDGKADFSGVFREHFDLMQVPLNEVTSIRSNWIDPSGMARLMRSYLEKDPSNEAMWILWCVYGCDKVISQSFNYCKLTKQE
jgi:asparagine synthase (glutamine-hydrolysing)